MKRLHLFMLLVVLVFAGIFLGSMFGGRRGAFAGCSSAVVMVGAAMWLNAPREFDRHVRALEAKKGVTVQNVDEGRAQFVRAVRIPALFLMLIGFGTLIALLFLKL